MLEVEYKCYHSLLIQSTPDGAVYAKLFPFSNDLKETEVTWDHGERVIKWLGCMTIKGVGIRF